MEANAYPWVEHKNQRVEFKLEWTETAKKTMIAFANTLGGTLYFGVADDAMPVGIENYDDIEQKVINFARYGVDPDMSNLVRVSSYRSCDNKTIAVVSITPGDDRPYAFKGKNWTDGGVFVRVGSSTMQATRSEILVLTLQRKITQALNTPYL